VKNKRITTRQMTSDAMSGVYTYPGDSQSTAGGTSEPRLHCRWCGRDHGDRCPEVRTIEYFLDGSVKRVEFFAPTRSYSTDGAEQWRIHNGGTP